MHRVHDVKHKKVDAYAETYATHLFRDLHTRVLKKKKASYALR